MRAKGDANLLLERHLAELGLKFEKEYAFALPRKWRFDYYLPALLTGIEIEGAVFAQGRHTRGVGYEKDMQKHNAAIALGYKLLRFSTGQVLKGEARAFIKGWLCSGI